MGKAKEIRMDSLVKVNPITDNQKKAFEAYQKGKNLFLYGAAGTGKTFVSLYLAMQEVMKHDTPYDTVYIVRSAVPTREIGFFQAMRKIRQHCFKFLIRTWLSSYSNNLMNRRLMDCMID